MSDPYVPSHQHPRPARQSKVIGDTQSHSGVWDLVQVAEEATIESIQAPHKTNQEDLTGIALPVGFVINGPVTQIKLTAGTVECFESH